MEVMEMEYFIPRLCVALYSRSVAVMVMSHLIIHTYHVGTFGVPISSRNSSIHVYHLGASYLEFIFD